MMMMMMKGNRDSGLCGVTLVDARIRRSEFIALLPRVVQEFCLQ
jgi:hypothetical protein